MTLVDSDVLIWYVNQNLAARRAVASLSAFCISVVTDMEVMQGASNKDDLRRWRRWLEVKNIQVLPVDAPISRRAALLVEQLVLSHRIQLGDALIAATALTHGLPLLTANDKHFRAVPALGRSNAFARDFQLSARTRSPSLTTHGVVDRSSVSRGMPRSSASAM